MAKDDNNIAAVQLIIKHADFCLLVKTAHWLHLYGLSKCIGQTPCSHEHYLVGPNYKTFTLYLVSHPRKLSSEGL